MAIRYPESDPGTPDDPLRIGSNPPPGPRQWTTTANWQDPYNPPGPDDPYFQEWYAANPDYSGPMPTAKPGEIVDPPPPPPPTGGGGGGTTAPIGTIGDYTLPTAPTFTPPEFTPPPAFAYDPFTAPSGDAVLNDPGYQFRLKQGEQSLMNNRAARGILNTGGTLKDFLGYNQNFATQEYGNVWDRAADAYRTNRGNALDTYNTNYKTQVKDPYDLNYQGALDAFAPTMKDWETRVQDAQHQADERRRYAWLIGSS